MKDNPQYICIYKDSPGASNRYYGPFVSDSVASDFVDRLPEPLPGGAKNYRLLSPYTFDESERAGEEIVSRRNSMSSLIKAHNL